MAKLRGDPQPDSTFQTRHCITYERLPCWQDLPDVQYRAELTRLLRAAEDLARERRGEAEPLGVTSILAQEPTDKPRSSKFSPRPLCHTSSRDLWDAFKAAYQEFVALYCEASERFRRGEWHVDFPAYGFRPPCPP